MALNIYTKLTSTGSCGSQFSLTTTALDGLPLLTEQI